jgi:hypothetical protein
MNSKNYDYGVVIDADELDRDDDGKRIWVEDTATCGRLTLDGVEVSWSIGEGTWNMTLPNNQKCTVFDLIVDDSRDFRSRQDAENIYDAVVDALQERNHPERCECRDCDEDYDENRRLDQKADLEEMGEPVRQKLRELGLIESDPVFVDDGREITVEDVLGAPRKAESESEMRKLGL